MENIQGQFQKAIKGGKDKIQNSQEIIALKFKVSESEDARALLILEIGEIAYKKIRDGEIKADDFTNILDKIVELDKDIYSKIKTIDEKTKNKDGNIICSCGSELSSTDKFCVSCGTKVEEEVKEEEVELIICKKCQESISKKSNFCNCCGYKLEEGEIRDVL